MSIFATANLQMSQPGPLMLPIFLFSGSGQNSAWEHNSLGLAFIIRSFIRGKTAPVTSLVLGFQKYKNKNQVCSRIEPGFWSSYLIELRLADSKIIESYFLKPKFFNTKFWTPEFLTLNFSTLKFLTLNFPTLKFLTLNISTQNFEFRFRARARLRLRFKLRFRVRVRIGFS